MSRQRLDEKEANSRNQVNIVGMHLKISNIWFIWNFIYNLKSFEKSSNQLNQSGGVSSSPRIKSDKEKISPRTSELSRASSSKRVSETLKKQESNASSVNQQWKGKDTSSESSVHYKKK